MDAFSDNAMKLQVKGYNSATVFQNLRDCWESGIFTEVNWVIGVPGETDEDCQEGVDFILKNRKYIGRFQFGEMHGKGIIYDLNDNVSLTAGFFTVEDTSAGDDDTGVVVETVFSF